MIKETLSRWDELKVETTIKELARYLSPESNHFKRICHKNGLVEMVVQEHEGYEDDNPKENMRFCFYDNRIFMKASSLTDKPILKIIETKNMDASQLQTTLKDLLIRK